MHKIIGLCLVALLATGCLGGKRAPDETRVVAGPQLILPPEYGLVPPEEGAVATPAERAANAKVTAAQEALLGGAAAPAPSTEEANWLLGEQKIDPNIREKLAADDAVATEKEGNRTFIDKILGN